MTSNKRLHLAVLFAISTSLLIFSCALTYAMLLSKNEQWKSALKEKGDISFKVATAMAEHIYYDGDSVSVSQVVKHYNRMGKLLGECRLNEVMQGEKVVVLLSTNCCSSCVMEEINKLRELSDEIGRERILVIADFDLHSQRAWTVRFGEDGYYETDLEHLGLEGSPTRDTPVVMLTQNGRVKTSFIVGQQTIEFADAFHDYLKEYFKGRK